jgi:adenosylmethionine-8-amino-7-oxononanoate aminotransferase
MDRAAVLGEYLRGKLKEVARRSPLVGDVRGTGLLQAIELVGDKTTKAQLPVRVNAPARLTHHGLAHGIALYNRRANQGEFGDFQMVAPPLTATESEIDELVHLLELALEELHRELYAQGLVA